MCSHHTIHNNWGFWYGPDIIRGADGQFYVCEDNIGYVGGMGDLLCARKVPFSLIFSFKSWSLLVNKEYTSNVP